MMFRLGDFKLNSGASSPFKIDCDALTDEDLQCLAWLIARRVPAFASVEGVPRGGLRLAKFLWPFCEPDSGPGRLLIVDDVCTTGGSMERHRAGRLAIGAVIFARGPCPEWVMPLFTMRA